MDEGSVRPGEIEATTRFLSSAEVRRYEGEWVAVLDGKVLAHGAEADEVLAEAKRKARGREPVLHLVSSMAEIL
jgi:hypothetical protein